MKRSTPVSTPPAPASPPGAAPAGARLTVVRFRLWSRLTHGVLALAVFGLVFTGMPLKYAGSTWAGWLIRMWGGARLAGRFHRGFALMFLAAGAMHVGGIVAGAIRGRRPAVFGPDGIMFHRRDLRHVSQYLRFLRGKGDRPAFGRFTYWEKFDYFAEIWGLLVIGLSGLVMWFPEISARLLPGWMVNAALIFHSYEALLAAAFLFAIHFVNTHLRPDTFPVDRVIFTGRMPLEEAEERYPGWTERLRSAGSPAIELASMPRGRGMAWISGIFVSLGLTMLLLIMSAALTEAVRGLVQAF